MSLFRKKPSTAARERLYDPDFACSAPGADLLRIEYDSAVWVRLPTVGVDRTDWVERVQEAYAEDLGWTPGTPDFDSIGRAADIIADTELSYTASLATFLPGGGAFGLAHVHVLDEELMLLEYADPERFLDNESSRPQTFPRGWRYNDFTRPGQGHDGYLRAHKVLETDPPIHLVGLGRFNRPRLAGPVLGVIARSRVGLTDGRVL